MNSKDAAINEMCVDGIQATTLALQNRDQSSAYIRIRYLSNTNPI